MKKHLENVMRAHPAASVLGGRVGTLMLDRSKLVSLVGNPSQECGPETVDDGMGGTYQDSPKVTVTWIFKCPRGNFEIRDYWWNRPGEWSIAAAGTKTVLWARSYARQLSKIAS